ncbi:hypothetical protein [Methylogaea oryzae]|uniref:Uncharacterized protein n=1 Tax=Methylogaea oryzae TaxID=1295382 RepID=A0A8D5AKC6_9GAMM|nr:hypothetical protein [Methylogaea oryzae]BBL70981.1 hypothetical protein MoryE10_15870 [Methylogaea oryzae]
MEILLKGAVVMIVAALAAAWLMTFARWFPIQGVDGGFLKDYKTMIRAHVDYILMALLCLGLYGIKIPLSVTACWLVVIGGFTNPTVFTIAAFKPDFWEHRWARMYTAASFAVSTAGFLWVSKDILAAV